MLNSQYNSLTKVQHYIENDRFEDAAKELKSNNDIKLQPLKIDYGKQSQYTLKGYVTNKYDEIKTDILNNENDKRAGHLPDTHELMSHSIQGLTHIKNTSG